MLLMQFCIGVPVASSFFDISVSIESILVKYLSKKMEDLSGTV